MKSTGPEKDIEELILDGVDRLLAHYGYASLKMEDLAKEVGISPETIYARFPTKEDLMLSHIDRIALDVINRLRSIAELRDSPEKKIHRMLLLRVMLRFDSVQHYFESLSDVLRDLRSELLERREHYFQAEARVFAKVLEEGRKNGVFNVGDCRATARVLVVATNSVLPFSLTAYELSDRSKLEQTTTRLADVLVRALVDGKPVSK